MARVTRPRAADPPPGMQIPLKSVWLFGAVAAGAYLLPGLSPARDGPVEHGAYLVHHVAHCSACHTPRSGDGRPLPDQLLKGAPVPVDAPPYPGWEWASRAPALAGLPGWSDEDAVRFLRDGIVPRTGRAPRRPMPPFRFSEADARAVVAYLRSLR